MANSKLLSSFPRKNEKEIKTMNNLKHREDINRGHYKYENIQPIKFQTFLEK